MHELATRCVTATGFANETDRDRETTRDTCDAHEGLRLVSGTH
jgi:hypothetical protein